MALIPLPIRIIGLPYDATPSPTDEVAIDGASTRRTTIADLIDAGAAQIGQIVQANVPIYVAKASAEAATVAATVRSIQTQFLAPTYTTFSTLVGGGYYARMSKADIDAAGYPAQTYFRSTDRFMPNGSTDAVNGGYWVDSDPEPQPEKYGVINDQFVADNTAAWNNYFAAMKALNRPIIVKSVLRSRITSTVTCPAFGLVAGIVATGAYIDLRNVSFRYFGPRNAAGAIAFKFGQTDLQLREAFIYQPNVAAGNLAWGGAGSLQVDDSGIQFVNVYFCGIFENFTSGFTKGIECTGFGYNTIFGKHILDCKFGRVYTTYGNDPNASYTNENVVFGGRISCTSATALLGSAYGQVFTWDKVASYRGQNNNRFYGCTFEPGAVAGAKYRVPVLFDGAGALNWFEQCRVEVAKGPAMICSGGNVNGVGAPTVTWNVFKCSFNLGGAGTQSNSILELNGATANRYEGPGSSVHHWSKRDLGKLVKSGGAATSAYLKDRDIFIKQGAAAASKNTTTASAIGSHKDGILIANGTRVGTAVDVSKIKTFMFRNSTQDGFYGRMNIYCFDASGAPLTGNVTDDHTTAGADDWLKDAAEQLTWGTEQYVKGASPAVQSAAAFNGGNPYVTGGDGVLGRESWISFRDEVKTAYIMIGGGTNPCVLHGLEIDGYSTMNAPGEIFPTVTGMAAMRVYSPLDDDGETIKVTADPITAGGHGFYAAGDLMGISNAAPASASAAMWFALTGGWLAPAWTISTAYAVPGQLVTNDTGKIYQLVTAGTSAGAGGPTGTGTGIADNTCVWDYIGVKPTSGAINRA